MGFDKVEIDIKDIKSTDQDPLVIEINYPEITDYSKYIQPRVLVEIGSRSLREPFTDCKILSLVGEYFSGSEFADTGIIIPSVKPERTFLEKLFLLHEEFQRPEEKIRVDRLSRHLYDIYMIWSAINSKQTLVNQELYKSIIKHRECFVRLGGVNYESHYPPNLNPIPPERFRSDWEKDYKEMQEYMIIGESLPFEKLIDEVSKIVAFINNQKFK